MKITRTKSAIFQLYIHIDFNKTKYFKLKRVVVFQNHKGKINDVKWLKLNFSDRFEIAFSLLVHTMH